MLLRNHFRRSEVKVSEPESRVIVTVKSIDDKMFEELDVLTDDFVRRIQHRLDLLEIGNK